MRNVTSEMGMNNQPKVMQIEDQVEQAFQIRGLVCYVSALVLEHLRS